VVDDAGDTLRLAAPVRRIVSLNPSTTELLFALGAGDRVAGRTDACDYPEAAGSIPSVGGGFPPVLEPVLARRPDLVVLYRMTANEPVAARLRELGIPVLRLRTDRLSDVARAARALGGVTGRRAAGDSLADGLLRAMDAARARTADVGRPGVVLLASDQPVIALGAGSFLSELAELAGARNVFADVAAPSVPTSLEAIAARSPAAVLLAGGISPGFTRRPEWQTLPAIRAGRILSLTASAFTRPSPRGPAAARDLGHRLDALLTRTAAGATP
jgi:ABC-type Fe3+-hydroxamate transport system substrate-binding protein